MNIHSLAPLLSGVIVSGIGIFTLSRAWHDARHRAFALLAACIAVWCVHLFGLTIARDEFFALFWTKIFAVGMFFLPACFLHFVLLLRRNGRGARSLLRVAYLLGAFYTFLHWAGWFVRQFEKVTVMYKPRPTAAYWSFILYFVLSLGYALVIFVQAFRREGSAAHRKSLRNIILAIVLGGGIGLTNLALGVRGGISYPIAYLGGVVFMGITGYTLLKTRPNTGGMREK